MVFGLFKSKKQKKEALAIKKLQKSASNTRMGRGASNTRTKATKALNQKGIQTQAQKDKTKAKASKDQKRLETATKRSKQGGRTGAAARRTAARLKESGVNLAKKKKKRSNFADTSQWD